MAKLIIATITIFSLLFIILPKSCNAKKQETTWFQVLGTNQGYENVARIHCYVHDFSGTAENKTMYEVVPSPIAYVSSTKLGQIQVMDERLTAEPDINSEELGRYQGSLTSADFENRAHCMVVNFYFTSGDLKGSTLTLVGRNQVNNATREMSIVGGTGALLMARGYATLTTYAYDEATEYYCLEYKIYVEYKTRGWIGGTYADE